MTRLLHPVRLGSTDRRSRMLRRADPPERLPTVLPLPKVAMTDLNETAGAIALAVPEEAAPAKDAPGRESARLGARRAGFGVLVGLTWLGLLALAAQTLAPAGIGTDLDSLDLAILDPQMA